MTTGRGTGKSSRNLFEGTKVKEMEIGVQTRSMLRKMLEEVKNDKKKGDKLSSISRKSMDKAIAVDGDKQIKGANSRKNVKIVKDAMVKGTGKIGSIVQLNVQTGSMLRKRLEEVKNDQKKGKKKIVKLGSNSRKSMDKVNAVDVDSQLKGAKSRRNAKIVKDTMTKGRGTGKMGSIVQLSFQTRSMKRKELEEIMIIEDKNKGKRIKLSPILRSKVDIRVSEESAASQVFRNPIAMDLVAKFLDYNTLKSLRQVNKGCKPFVTQALIRRSLFVLDSSKRALVQEGSFVKQTKKLKGITSLRLPYDSYDEIRTVKDRILAHRKLFSQLFTKPWTELDFIWLSTWEESAQTGARFGKLLETNKNRLVSLRIRNCRGKFAQANPIFNFPSTFPNLKHLDLVFNSGFNAEFNMNFGGPVEYSKMFPKLKSLRVSHFIYFLDHEPSGFNCAMNNLFPQQVFNGLEMLEIRFYFGGDFRFRGLDEERFKKIFPNAVVSIHTSSN